MRKSYLFSCARRIDKLSRKSSVLCSLARKADRGSVRSMRELLILAIHSVVTFAKLLRPGGTHAWSQCEFIAFTPTYVFFYLWVANS